MADRPPLPDVIAHLYKCSDLDDEHLIGWVGIHLDGDDEIVVTFTPDEASPHAAGEWRFTLEPGEATRAP